MPTSAAPSGTPGAGPGGGAGGPEKRTVTRDFFGVTTDGKRIYALFTTHSNGVHTVPVIAFPCGLTDTQRTSAHFSVHPTESWRRSNVDA